MTFHLQLHRYYAMFLSKVWQIYNPLSSVPGALSPLCSELTVSIVSQAVKCQGLDLESLLPDQEMLMRIMVHPLQIQVLHQYRTITHPISMP